MDKKPEQIEKQELISDKIDLQDAFKKFRKQKFERLKHSKYLKSQKEQIRRTPDFKENLRKKFVEQAKKYFGVPYHKRYLTPEDENYNSPLFLDCCGLIRQVIYDLREDFGFTLGRWNQSYQFDILPKTITKEEAKPGDLVFISATYYNEKLKPFPHKMTHVEIYTGGETGEQTIGARWQRGVVQYHDSYKFVSKTYHTMTFIFKSIDTWLEGVCRSFCEEHPWRDDRDNWVPDKYSIFNEQENAEDAEPEEINQEEQITDQKENKLKSQKLESNIKNVFIGSGNNDKLIRDYFEKQSQDFRILPKNQAFTKNFYFKWVQCLQELDFFSFQEGKQIINHIPNVMQVIGNKSALINTLQEFSKEEKYKFSHLDFFPESYQLDNMADEIAFINSKTQGTWILKPKNLNMGRGIQIITDINQFKKEFVQSKKFYLGEFVTSYMIDHSKKEFSKDEAEKVVLEKRAQNNKNYIKDNLKQSQELTENKMDTKNNISDKNQDQKQEINETLENGLNSIQKEQEIETKYKNISTQSIIQKYIENPLLCIQKKFDIRCYGLIASSKPYLLLFHHGYLRFCLDDYTNDNLEDFQNNKFSHLTNAAIQKKHPQYKQEKENTIWTMNKFEKYLKESLKKSEDEIDNLNRQIKNISTYVLEASMKKLEKKLGQYELFGIDIIIDENLKPYLLEVNSNPALFCDAQAQKDTIPQMMHSALDIVLKVNEQQSQDNQIELDESIIKNWEVIYDERQGKSYLKEQNL